MEVLTLTSPQELGAIAAQYGAEAIKHAIEAKGTANIILATGTSQFETIKHLVSIPGIDWSKVTAFHLDEYLGLAETHPASFRKYLKERFVAYVPTLKTFHFVNGEAQDPQEECERLGQLIQKHPIDVAFIGIGENGHLAFNDPPADFKTERPFLVVTLDEACRKQQLGEGWFATLDDVPRQAISMSIPQILKSQRVCVSVPHERKAQAVKCAVEGEVSNMCPASILRTHPECKLFLDPESASLLPQ
ncbi:glucosamine/galactosamine-6-phosphate isomerase [Candidatus Vecturithrix granuli]|uniref:Glucosamine/galactosamine-6-phosphate isomerase n=1 Tax=Vecturithrix granuli TaxID=1499967 RepID=A0A0S6WA90_VECG1|nr:glucosamine/galactosamine-6-phosphate isomerase [Candidatus Vecturithrix granuli]